MGDNFVAEVAALAPARRKLAENLVKKMASYSHWPDAKKHGAKLLPFIESKEMVFLMAGIAKAGRFRDYPEFREDYHIGYATFVHIFIQYALNQKEGHEEIAALLCFMADEAVRTAMRDERDNHYYMLKWIFALYKADKEPALDAAAKIIDKVPRDKLMFSFEDGDAEYQVGAYTHFTSGDVRIPASHNGKPVKKLAYGAFQRCDKLTSIEIPEGVEVLDTSAFAGCSRLKSIVLPESLKEIRKFAFASTGLKEIVIPAGVEKIGENAFAWAKVSCIKVAGRAKAPAGWDEKWNRKDTFHSGSDLHDVVWDYKAEAQ